MPGQVKKSLPSLTVADAAAWQQWLSKQAAESAGVWLTLAKKGTTIPTSLSLDQALEEALCYGWINGQGFSIDEATYTGRFTPRTSTSIWSKRNVGIVERLESEGRMTEAGCAAIDAAKADGRWEKAYAGPATAEAPADLLAAVEAEPRAQKTWDGVSKQSRWMMYFQLNNLRTSAGREKRIQNYVDMMAKGELPHPQASSATRPKVVKEKTAKVYRKVPNKKQNSASTGASHAVTRTKSGRHIRPPLP